MISKVSATRFVQDPTSGLMRSFMCTGVARIVPDIEKCWYFWFGLVDTQDFEGIDNLWFSPKEHIWPPTLLNRFRAFRVVLVSLLIFMSDIRKARQSTGDLAIFCEHFYWYLKNNHSVLTHDRFISWSVLSST